jgi:hypothetical protein
MMKYDTETHKQELKDSKPLRDRYCGEQCVENRIEKRKTDVGSLEVFKINKRSGSCNGCKSLIEASDGSAYCTVEDSARWTDEVKTALKYFFS